MKFILLIITLFLCVYTASAQGKNCIEWQEKLIEDLMKEDAEAIHSTLSPEVKGKMSGHMILAFWKNFRVSGGSFAADPLSEAYPLGDTACISYTHLVFDSSSLRMRVFRNDEGLITGLFFVPGASPVYKLPPYANEKIIEKQIMFGKDFPLKGTLTLPAGVKNPPVVILVHGSGPSDRNEAIGPNRPFQDLAIGLASKGIATFRYDKRTWVYPFIPDELTPEYEVLEDVDLAIEMLKSRKDVNTQKIFVAGHSLGAMLAPKIALRHEALSGLIMLAGTGRSLETLVLEQTRYLNMLDDTLTAFEQKAEEKLKAQIALLDNLYAGKEISGTLPLGLPASYWQWLKEDDVFMNMRLSSVPILVLQGERDYQVTMQQDYGLMLEALGFESHISWKSFPGLNHLFIHGTGKPGPAEYNIPGHVSAEVILVIAEWIKKQ